MPRTPFSSSHHPAPANTVIRARATGAAATGASAAGASALGASALGFAALIGGAVQPAGAGRGRHRPAGHPAGQHPRAP
jgi:hypothetical protein